MKNRPRNRFRQWLRTVDQTQSQTQKVLTAVCGVSGLSRFRSNGYLASTSIGIGLDE